MIFERSDKITLTLRRCLSGSVYFTLSYFPKFFKKKVALTRPEWSQGNRTADLSNAVPYQSELWPQFTCERTKIRKGWLARKLMHQDVALRSQAHVEVSLLP